MDNKIRVTAIVAAVSTLLLGIAPVAVAHTESYVVCNPLGSGNIQHLPGYDRIMAEWRARGAENGPLGCQAQEELPTAGQTDPEGVPESPRGVIMAFEHGTIVFAPDQGDNMVVVGYQQGRSMVIDWGSTDPPYHYDFFIVRGGDGGKGISNGSVDQWDVTGASTNGHFTATMSNDGALYWYKVEGCDGHGFSRSTCNQSWAPFVWVYFNRKY